MREERLGQELYGRASCWRGGLCIRKRCPDSKAAPPLFKKNKQENKQTQQITHRPGQRCFYVRDFTNVAISVKKYQQNYSEGEKSGMRACLDRGNFYQISSTGASCCGDLGASKSGLASP